MTNPLIAVCAQYKAWPYLTRCLTYSRQDLDMAAATVAHFQGDSDYQRVWWYNTGREPREEQHQP